MSIACFVFLGGEDMFPRLDENNSTHMGEEPPHIISSRCGNGRAGRLKSGGLDPSILAPFRLQRRPKRTPMAVFTQNGWPLVNRRMDYLRSISWFDLDPAVW